ncbi:MAG: hypothetical protein Q8L95_10195 [Burkholderiales bacterium]|nr:hypothetical protein [Burkholderiales bacterium]
MAMTPGPDMEQDPQLAAIYRAAADAAPPAHLDDAVRAAARREVAAAPRRHGFRRWSVPISLAAVIVLSVTVVTMMREQGADRLETMTLPQPVEIPAVTAPRDAAGPPAVAVLEAAPKRRPAASPPVVAPAEPAAKTEVSAPAPTVSGRVAAMDQGVVAFGGDSRAKAGAAESTRAEDSAAGARRDSIAPQQSILRTAPAPLADAATGAGASPRSAAPAATMSAAPAKSVPLWQDLIREPPEKWIERIVELRRAGKTADADTLVAEFHRRFPDQRLPDGAR